MEKINFSYLDKDINIQYGNEKIILNVEEESLNEIRLLNNFILKKIGENVEIDFVFIENKSNSSRIMKNIINSIILIYREEYEYIKKEIIDDFKV
jgi:hypothetical protein